jgi:hypothetical protein
MGMGATESASSFTNVLNLGISPQPEVRVNYEPKGLLELTLNPEVC